jgi:hypothetical protein
MHKGTAVARWCWLGTAMRGAAPLLLLLIVRALCCARTCASRRGFQTGMAAAWRGGGDGGEFAVTHGKLPAWAAARRSNR